MSTVCKGLLRTLLDKPPHTSPYVHSRVLKINAGFLLGSGLGTTNDSRFDFPAIMVADDLYLEYLRGPLRLSRTTEGILVQAQLEAGLTGECYRCLDPVTKPVTVQIEELFTFDPMRTSEFRVLEDGILDLAPLLRAEVLIENTRGFLCRPHCKGLCPNCGVNWNHNTCSCADEAVDPRLAALRKFLE